MPASHSRARRIIHNTFLLFGSEKAAQIFSLAAFVFLTRRWDVGTYGQYALIKNWVAIFATFSDLGLNSLTIREVAHRRSLAGYYLRNVMGIRSIFSIVLVAGLAVVGRILHYEPIIVVGLIIMGCRIIFDCVAGAYVYLLQAHEKMGIQGAIVVMGSVIRLGGIVLVIFLGWGLWGACGVWVFASIAALAVLAFISLEKGWRLNLSQWKWSEVRQVLGQALPLAAFWSLQTLYFQVDTVILKSLKGNESVGFYDAAYTFLRSTLSLSQLFGLSILPAFSAARDQKSDFGKLALRSIKLLLMAGIPITVGGALLANPLIVLFSGDKYLPSGQLFSVLVLSIVPFFISNIYINVLTVRNANWLNLLYFSLLLLNVILNFLMIPIWAAQGAAWATVICEWIGMVWGLWLIRVNLITRSKIPVLFPALAALAASVLMGIAIHSDPRLYWLVLGPLVYGVLLWLFRGLDKDDMSSIRSVLRLNSK